MMNDGARRYKAGDDYVEPDGTKLKVIREVGDYDGLLSFLMSQAMDDEDSTKPVPAMQSLVAVMGEAYNHGAEDLARKSRATINQLSAKNENVLRAKQDELNAVRMELKNERQRTQGVQKTIANLRAQLKDAKAAAKQASVAEPAAEPVAVSTTGDAEPVPTNGQNSNQ